MPNTQPPGIEQPNTPPNPPVNPLYDGTAGKVALTATVGGLSLTAIFFVLDTLQFIFVGHESHLFTALAHGVGAVGIAGIIGTVLKSYIMPRSNDR